MESNKNMFTNIVQQYTNTTKKVQQINNFFIFHTIYQSLTLRFAHFEFAV